MERDQLLVMIGIVLSVGSGAIAQALTSWFIGNYAPTASPLTKRHLSYVAHILVPSLAYMGQVLIEPAVYDWIKHVYYIAVSFGVGTFIHGVTRLPRNGTFVSIEKAELEQLKMYEVAATSQADIVIPLPRVEGTP